MANNNNYQHNFTAEAPVKTAQDTKPELIRAGYPHGKKDVPGQYLIKISGFFEGVRHVLIRALLQEKVALQVTSEFAPFTSANWLSKRVTETFQAISALTKGEPKALYPTFSTRRLWTGTSPIMFNLPLKFAAEKSAYFEVVLPCQELHRMALPSVGGAEKGILGKFIVTPPGPSPFVGARKGIHAGNLITVKIGSFLTFKRVIIRNVASTFSNQFTRDGFPIWATATVAFETFEIVTTEDLDGIFGVTPTSMKQIERRTEEWIE